MSSLSTLPGASGKLLRRIHRACRPSLDEPNLALNLEICDLINDKQGSLPREAAIAIAKLINSRDPQVSELALSLLDILVKNCGYPFHLQISRKEFLNELVKRFPYAPPPAYTRLQRSILLLLEEWTQTLCKTSRYKEDLFYIKDMHRLLKSKGYEFPRIKAEDFAVLTPSDNLKSLEDIQKEEAVAQHAKLQELIRRGTPKDLKEANDLMKIMSGFRTDQNLINETNEKLSKDLQKMKRKLNILNEFINNSLNTGVFNNEDDTVIELYSSLKSSQPSLQKIINEQQNETNETELADFTLTDLLSLNDDINSALQKIDYLKKGDVSNASNVKSSSGGGDLLNLIDFDDEPSTTPAPANSKPVSTGDAINDLLSDLGSLSFNGASNTNSAAATSSSNNNLFGDISLLASPSPTPSPVPAAQSNPMDFFSSPPAPQKQVNTSSSDPFGFDFLSSPSTPAAVSSPGASNPSAMVLHQSNNLKLTYQTVNKSSNSVTLLIKFSNLQSQMLTGLSFSLAVTKQFELSLNPPSSTQLQGLAQDGVTQQMTISKKVNDGAMISTLKFKWKCSYFLGSQIDESGVANISV